MAKRDAEKCGYEEKAIVQKTKEKEKKERIPNKVFPRFWGKYLLDIIQVISAGK